MQRRGARIGVVVLVVIALVGFVFVTGNTSQEASPETTVADSLADTTTQETVAAGPFAYGTSECPPVDGSAEQRREFSDSHQLCIDPAKTYVANFDTTQGTFSVRLYADQAPGTVNNFVSLARWKYFDGTKCHRVIQDFVVQCGDPTATGTGGPGYSFADELPSAGEYKIGSLAMANSGPNTNGSQFFITLAPTPWLDNKHAIFGEVVEGNDVVQKIGKTRTGAMDRPAKDIVITSVKITKS